jgi:2-polyprenyl-6-methoxyphenol hydroxylase-like FAD-dependent oxidoreductase
MPSQHVAAKALIIGAGIAGPAAALFLRRAGIRAEIFDGRAEPETIGGGITIAPNGMKVLEHLGLDRRLASQGGSMERICFRDAEGRLLARYDNARPGQFDQPAVAMPRAALHQALLESAGEAEIPLHFGKRLVDVVERSDEVVAVFDDGSEARGDYLVGADGIHSAVRRAFLPQVAPVYSGRLAVGGFVDGDPRSWDGKDDARQINLTLGASGSFGYCNGGARDRRWMWWSTARHEQEPSRSDLAAIPKEALVAELLERHAGWHTPVAEFIGRTAEIMRVPIYEVPRLPQWWRGRIVLIGDSAHAMSPQAGQGASVALEDAMYLAAMLKQFAGNHFQAFAAYEDGRRERAERIAEQARQTAERQTGDVAFWFMKHLLKIILPIVGPRAQRWMYDYQIDWPAPGHS